MKKIILLLIALTLLGCSRNSELAKLGYSKQDIDIISNLSEDTQMFFLNGYDEKYSTIINHPNFIENKLDKYIKYYDDFDIDFLFEAVNNDYNLKLIQDIFDDKYYMEKNRDIYLNNLDKFDDARSIVEYVNVQRYDNYYENEKPTDLSKNYYMLVNKYNYLTSDYIPNDLVEVDEMYGAGYLRQAVMEAFIPLYEDALEQGYDLRVVSPYRQYSTQERLYNMYLEQDPQEIVDTYSARPGHSEHQTGLCIDVSVPGYSLDDFYLTDASDWLKENCYKYGFIIRYPEGKDDITGYQWEPWQIRFVDDIAKDVYESGITYDEYYAYYLDK